MANVDPVRRAEIGRERRARTRAQLIAAAQALFARQAVESVTVDDVVKEAGVAKGTFYVHFDDLQSLTATVVEEVITSVADAIQPGMVARSDPASRIAFACCCLIDKALAEPAWASVLARLTAASGKGSEIGRRKHLFADLSALSTGMRGAVSPELSLEIYVGILIQLGSAFGEGRLSARDREPAIAAVLRAIGADARQIKSALASLPPSQQRSAPKPAAGAKPRPRAGRVKLRA
jgi:AcrR family transcriptional regulator